MRTEITRQEWLAHGGADNELLAKVWAYRGKPGWTYFRSFD